MSLTKLSLAGNNVPSSIPGRFGQTKYRHLVKKNYSAVGGRGDQEGSYCYNYTGLEGIYSFLDSGGKLSGSAGKLQFSGLLREVTSVFC